jgi:hypothetical protein
LANPAPSSFQPRYISGFGSDNSFTVFFEDRDNSSTISHASTTTGPTGFPASATGTTIADTHFVIKDWPINVGGTDYAYRAWGSVGNNMDHHFYVSNDLSTWTLVSTFTIPNAPGFTDAHGWVYYGFHDVIQLNGTYYAFAESNQSQTMLVRSVNGDDVWEAFASIGGRPGWGPRELPVGVSYGWTPSGSFVDLGHDRGYGKVYADPRDSAFYLAVNTEAKPSLPPADMEAAFINPANWTWHDGATGPAANPILSATAEHDLRECWVVPNSDPDADWVILEQRRRPIQRRTRHPFRERGHLLLRRHGHRHHRQPGVQRPQQRWDQTGGFWRWQHRGPRNPQRDARYRRGRHHDLCQWCDRGEQHHLQLRQ